MYVIDNKVLFNPEKNTLQSIDGDGVKDELARPTARLLLELIKRKNILVTREELLSLVWEDYGGIPSDSNLNNHLTLLRKRFDFWGIRRSTIETIPRKGVIFKAIINEENITISSEKAQKQNINLNEEVTPCAPPIDDAVNAESMSQSPPPPATMLVTPRIKGRSFLSRHRLYLSLLSIFILIFPTIYNVTKLPAATTKMDFVNIEQCHVYPIISGLHKIKSENREVLLTSLKKRISDNELSCKERKDLYIAMRPYNKNFYLYVSECKLRNASAYSNCLGYLLLEK
ncbi:winged helix-turn-helix domain-containing protein [Serratia marcescens]|uniref:winged helix-turn-helix domain-containing protein n=1 Tax=Serratia marcescens TaxID=615 RepID=UPI00148E35AD|nr:winged helix-turn-helix domain-containing protein [Serratia marcescens]QJU42298.1 hypothetical protein HMI62_24640 [Serratia marcescens]